MIEKEQIDAFIEEHKEEAVALLKELGKIPAPSFHEDKRAAFCEKWFQQLGCKDVYIDTAKNVICKLNCDNNQEITVFMAHTDIVFDDTEELPMTCEDNILRAPGIGDDTSNLVNLMMATKFVMKHLDSLNTGLLIVANSCEEGLGNLNGSKAVFNAYGDRIKEFYSFDGYMSQCTSIPVGSHRYQVKIGVQGGHSYLDFGNDNAICIAADLVRDLYKITPPEEAYTTYNVGRIEGGTTVNSIAQETTLLYEYRSSSEQCLSTMKECFNEVINKYRAAGKHIEVDVLGVRPGAGEMDQEAFQAWTDKNISLIRAYYDGEMDLRAFSTDANVPLSKGVFANTIGTIKGDGAHTRQEWVDLNSIPAGMGIAISLMAQYLDK